MSKPVLIVETHNCFGHPITAAFDSRGRSEYMGGHQLEAGEKLQPSDSRKELLADAIEFRAEPGYYGTTRGDNPEMQSEWAFVIEQLVAEGSL